MRTRAIKELEGSTILDHLIRLQERKETLNRITDMKRLNSASFIHTRKTTPFVRGLIRNSPSRALSIVCAY